MIDLRHIQLNHMEWQDRNFPGHETYHSFLGLIEELGELAHAMLKGNWGIKGTVEEHRAAEMDAIGDIFIFLMGVCNTRGYCIEDIIRKTWHEVKVRDFIKYPKNGYSK